MKKLLLLVLSGMPGLVFGQIKNFETPAKITDVIVYTSAAEISYEHEMNLPKGKSMVVFTDLTPYIIQNTVNVTVAGKGADIINVAERINYVKEKRKASGNLNVLHDSIAKMKKELGLLNVREEVNEMEKGLLFKNDAIAGFSTKKVAIEEMEKASLFFNKRYYELTKEIFLANERENELNALIKKYSDQLKESETVSVQNVSEIKITVSCTAETKVKFNFKFITQKAGWSPVYDFKFEGPAKPLQFVFRANIVNSSETMWPEVSLKLSTADPLRGFALPTSGEANSNSNVKFRQIETVNAISEYNVAHDHTILSDAKPYMVDVSAFAVNASFSYLLIPKVDPFGFLMAKVPDWNSYSLIPGTANIYNMGTYMGKTQLKTFAENDTLSLYLGKDKNIQCYRSEKTKSNANFFAGNYSTEETTTEIIVKNTYQGDLQIEIIDQVPVFTKTDDEKINVFNIPGALYDKEEGSIKWNHILKAGETLNINYGYEIKEPKRNGEYNRYKKRKFRTISCPAF